MDIGDIVSDSLRYPLSDWTKILMLGIILVIGNMANIAGVFTLNGPIITLLSIIGFLVGLLGAGYILRIIKSSLAGLEELPAFDEWVDLFIDGIKVTIVGIIYSLPAIILILVFAASIILSLFSNPSTAAMGALIGAGIGGILLAMLYMLIILPIIAIAIANMAYNDSELGAAFRFGEILNNISRIGWGDLIVWYIVIGIIEIILSLIGGFITTIFGIITPALSIILMALIVTPYLQMYLARAVALLYSSQEMTYSSQGSDTVSSK